MKQEIVHMVRERVGSDYLFFDSPLMFKLSPHTWPLIMYAVCVSPNDEIFLMDRKEEWHQLEESDVNYSNVLITLNQRLKVESKKTA